MGGRVVRRTQEQTAPILVYLEVDLVDLDVLMRRD